MLFDWVFNCSVVIADKQNGIIGWKKTIKDHESWFIPFVNPFRYLKHSFLWLFFRGILDISDFFLMLLMHEWERSYVIFWIYMIFFKVYLVLVGENLLFFCFPYLQLISSILHFIGETIILILFGLSTTRRILLGVLISLNI